MKNKNQSNETTEPENKNPKNSNNVFSDVFGSYTGVSDDGEDPVQDADDL